jgi:hypothetical protein
MIKEQTVKPFFAFIYSSILDRTLLKNEDFTSNMSFGLAVGASSVVGGFVGSSLASTVPTDTEIYSFSGKTLFQRAIELSIGGAGAYVGNRYVFQNDYANFLNLQRIGVIGASLVLADYTSDYFVGQQLSYLG